jgi:hypothetical protein
MVSMLFIHRGLDEVEAGLERLMAVQAPINRKTSRTPATSRYYV